jgi:uncharacterized protein (TIGR03435 family)
MPRIAVLLAFVPALAAQTFEVASIRPNATSDPGRQGGLFREHIDVAQGSVTVRNVTLKACLKWAYGLEDPQIAGPDWLGVERYDIVAKSAGPASEDQLRLMLRSLLVERFQLAAHIETRAISAIALATGSGAPKLKESTTAGPGTFHAFKRGILARGATMAEFAALLSDPLRSPVVDTTGLVGRYDFFLDYTTDVPQPGETPDERSVTLAAVRQLGLKLEGRKLPLPVLIVDRAAKTPIEN